MSIPAAFAAKPTAIQSEQSVIAVAERAIAVSVFPSGPPNTADYRTKSPTISLIIN
jgi:hypothetical protein